MTSAQQILSDVQKINERTAILVNDHPREALALSDQALEKLSQLNGYSSSMPALRERSSALLSKGICTARLGQYREGMSYVDDALSIIETLSDKQLYSKAHICKAYIYRFLAELDLAKEHYAIGLQSGTEAGDKQLMARAQTGLGLLCFIANDYRCALDRYIIALELQEEINDTIGIGWTLLNIGATYRETNNFPKAIEFFFRSLEIWKKLNDKRGQAITIQNIGLTVQEEGDFDTALSYLEQAGALFDEVNDVSSLSNALKNVAAILVEQKKFDDAELFYQRSLKVLEGSSARFSEAGALLFYSEFLVLREKYNDALFSLMKAAEILQNAASKSDRATILLNLGKIIWHAPALAHDIDWKLLHCNPQPDISLAEFFLLEAYREERSIGERSPDQKIVRTLADFYRHHGDFEKALLYFEEYHALEKEAMREEAAKHSNTLLLRFEMEQALKEAEIERLKSIELARANEELKALQQERDEFLNIVVHDLKNPLSNIKMLSNILLKDGIELSPEEDTEIKKNIVSDTERMFRLISNLLRINAIEQNRVPLQLDWINPEILFVNVLQNYSARAAAKEIFLHEEIHANVTKIVCDPLLLIQILDNLISNAIKFSPPGKNVRLKIAADENLLTMDVIDEGPGLTDVDKEKIFGKFARLSAQPTGGEDSTGLGLSIVKKLVDLLGGNISCESTPGHGATFHVEIPLDNSEAKITMMN